MEPKRGVMPCLTFIGALLSIPIIVTGIWLNGKQDNECLKTLQWPVITLGVVMLVVAAIGFMGAFARNPYTLVFYFVVTLILLVILTVMVVFIYTVTARGHGHSVPFRAYKEYFLDEFSFWMRRQVRSSSRWDSIRQCLSSSTTCASLNQRFSNPQDFFNAKLTPIQSGCCKPPTECGYTFVNPTYWISPINQAADLDCLQWSNDQTQLCYSCDSCKAGFLANLRKEWRIADLVLCVTLVAMIFVYLVACGLFRRMQADDVFSRYNKGYT